MNRFSGRAWLAVAGLAIVLAMTHVAEAQRGEGGRGRGRGFGRGGFGLTTVQLATAEEVQAALKFTDEQKDKVEQINDELRQARRELRDQGGDDFRAMMTEMQKLNDESATKLAEALDETQNKRLLGILAQLDTDAALSNATIAKDLKITDEQKESLGDVRNENREAMGEAMQELRDQELSREEMTAKMDELRTNAGKKLLAALTTDQQAQFEALKGEPVKVDMTQFRFGGGRGGGGGGGGREGRRGNRDGGDGGAADRGA